MWCNKNKSCYLKEQTESVAVSYRRLELLDEIPNNIHSVFNATIIISCQNSFRQVYLLVLKCFKVNELFQGICSWGERAKTLVDADHVICYKVLSPGRGGYDTLIILQPVRRLLVADSTACICNKQW